jgi:putative endonuclease
MSPTELGRQAENLAKDCLGAMGLVVLEQNWRTRWCEIDLVARDSAATIHFVEVKYRRSADFGTGFEYITPDKARRLRLAALSWMTRHRARGSYQIDVVSVTGDLADPRVDYLANAIED